MKQLIYIAFVLMAAGQLLAGCDATDNDFDNGWDTNRTDSSNVTVDTLQGIDASMYEKARVFPGLVDTAKEVHVKDTVISLDLSKKYKSMVALNMKWQYASSSRNSDTREMPQPIYSTGLYVGAGELITITIPDNVWGLTAQIGVQSDDLTSNNAGLREPIVYTQKTLYPGKNTLRSPLGGYLWILRDPNKLGDQQTSVKIENAYAAPDFILGRTNTDEWAKRVKATTVPWLDLRGEHFAFSVDRQYLVQYILNDAQFPQKMAKALTVWDGLISNYYDSFGFQEGAADPFYAMPQFQERFVFDVQLAGNKVTRVDNPQGLMMVQTNRLYDNLVNLDSLSTLNIKGIYPLLIAKYEPVVTPLRTLEAGADYVPAYRQAEANKKSGISSAVGDLMIGFTEKSPAALSYAAADSAKLMEHDFKSTELPAYTLLPLVQLAKYAAQYRNEAEWTFYRQVWADCRKEDASSATESYFFQKLCDHYQVNFAPFFDQWGLTISDKARASAEQYPLLDKSIWNIDPLAVNPFAKVGSVDAGQFRHRVDRSSWEILAVDGQGRSNDDKDNGLGAENLLDGVKNGDKSCWRNYLSGDDSPYELPYYIVINMKQNVNIDGFYFANGNVWNGTFVSGFTVQTTNSSGFSLNEHDKQTWHNLGEVGTSSAPQKKTFNEQFFKFQNSSHNVRYLRLIFDKPNLATLESTGKSQADFDKYHWNRRQMMAEFGVYYYKK